MAYAIYLENILVIGLDGQTLLQRLTATNSIINFRNWHIQEYSAYVLESKVQTFSIGLPKWEPSARIGVYLSRFFVHMSNITIVLNPSSCYI